MDIKTFYKNFNFDELKVLSVNGDGKTLKMNIEMEVYIPLIANGFRPEFDLDYIYEFSFASTDIIDIKEPIEVSNKILNDNSLVLTVNKKDITLLNQGIKIKKIN